MKFLICCVLLATVTPSYCQLDFYSELSEPEDELLIALESQNINTNPRVFQNFANSNNRMQHHKWFTQKLDHDNLAESNTRPWEQRYVEYGVYHKPDGPVFLHIDGEGLGLSSPIDLIKKGSMAQYAKEQGAYFVALEHRFYGLSHPTTDLSRDNLKFLNIRQAIGDIAVFISWFKTHRGFQSNKWVLFGSSYGGSLAKWFNQMYPNMTDVLITSSAPLELKYEMTDYLEHIGDLIKQTDSKCFQDLTEGFTCLEDAVKANGKSCGENRYGPADLKPLFNLCGDLRPNEEHDITGLFYTIFNTFNNIIVNNIPNPKLNVSLQGVCQNLQKSAGRESPLVRMARVLQEITRASEVNCVEFRLEKVIKYIRSTSWKDLGNVNGDRQFQWQRCNELGWVKGSNTPMMPFGSRISTSFHAEICKRVFGISEETTKQNIQQANLKYAGKSIPGRCGIYVSGNADPWSRLGVTSEEEVGVCNRAIVIQGASHAKDRGNIQPDISTTISFPPDLRPAQREIGKILDSWLKTGNCCEPKPSNPGGRILTDRYFYPIPTTNSPTQIKPTANFGQKLQFPSDLPTHRNSTVPSIQFPNNEISIDETRRVETRTAESDKLGGIDIQSDVELKELTNYIKKHEKQFFTSNKSNSNPTDGKRYRVRIRTRTSQPGNRGHGRGGNFSKFGVKIRMTDSKPAVIKNNDALVVKDSREGIKIKQPEQEPWWLWKDTFEPRKLTSPNPKPVRIHTASNEVAFVDTSRQQIKRRKSSGNKISIPIELKKSQSGEESSSQGTITASGHKHKDENIRGERKLVVLNLNDNDKERELFMVPDSSEIESTRFVKDNEGKSAKPTKRVPLKIKNRDDHDGKIYEDKPKIILNLNHKTQRNPERKNKKYNDENSNESQQNSGVKAQNVTKIVFRQIRRKQDSQKIKSDLIMGSHEAPLFIAKPKSTRTRLRNVHVIDDNPLEIGIFKLNEQDVRLNQFPKIKNRSGHSRETTQQNGEDFKTIPLKSNDKFIDNPSSEDGLVIIRSKSENINPLDVNEEQKKNNKRPLQPKSIQKKPRKTIGNSDNFEPKSRKESDEVTLQSDEERDNKVKTVRKDTDQESTDDVDKDIQEESDKSEEGEIVEIESNLSNEYDEEVQDDTSEYDENDDIPESKALKPEDAVERSPDSEHSEVKPKVKKQVRPSSKSNNASSRRIKSKNTDKNSLKEPSIIEKQNLRNSTSSSKNGPQGPKIFIEVEGKKIPVDNLDWRELLNSEAQIADLSVAQKSDNLALTGNDAAWVNYGIPWFPNQKA